MATSKSGGTRSYLKGKVGSDVYSVGKDGKGKKQQVVRGLAETVANPRTQSQMIQRMFMAGASELAKGLRFIIDHSFDGVSNGQPSISAFMAKAIQSMKTDSKLATPKFGYLPYGSKALPNAAVQVAEGKARIKADFYKVGEDTYFTSYGGLGAVFDLKGFYYAQGATVDEMKASAPTFGDIADLIFGGSKDNYLTVAFLAGPRATSSQATPVAATHVEYVRFKMKDSVDLTEKVTESLQQDDWLEIETTLPVAIQVCAGTYISPNNNAWVQIDLGGNAVSPHKDYCFCAAACAILSKKTASGWSHSDSILECRHVDTYEYVANRATTATWVDAVPKPATYAEALATYPLGTERFLNGGDL